MKGLSYQPFYETLRPRPDCERPLENPSRQPSGRTLSWQITLSYPSPPMSSPPSPQRKSIQNLPATSNSPFGLSVVTTASSPSTTSGINCLAPILAGVPAPASPPSLSSAGPAGISTAYIPPFATRTSSTSTSNEGPLTLYRTESASSASGIVDSQVTAGPSTSTLPSGSGRGGRRSKSHVVNACNNCKRAHLSCDVERPCNRCVQTGKGDTCRDVPHKKRGRPRLRDDGEVKAQQLDTAVPVAGSSEIGQVIAQGRGGSTAGRHRRAGSLRTLRSYPEDSSLPPVSLGPPPPALGPAFVPQPRAPRPAQGYVTPVAFLDLDLNVMKVNPAFQSLMGIRDLRRLRLSDLARPMEGDSLQNARNALRAEREAKEPSYLPPILQPGLDPVSGITDQDIEEITRGFDDQHYNWVFRLAGGVERSLEVKMRLAKTSLYFVTLSLPPLQESQIEQQSNASLGRPFSIYTATQYGPVPPVPQFQSSPPQFVDSTQQGREASMQATSPSPYFQSQGGIHLPTIGPPASQLSSGSYPPFDPHARLYPPLSRPQYQSTYQPIQPPPPPQSFQMIQSTQERPLTADSSSVGSVPSPFAPPSSFHHAFAAPRPRSDTLDSSSHYSSRITGRPRSETMESLGRHVQNRLRADSGVTTSAGMRSSPPQSAGVGQQYRGSSDESNRDEHGPSPHKRRRMNLDEVLHQR